MMKYLQTLLVLLAIVIICNTALSQPKIKIINPNIDLGEISYTKESVTARIEITNEGTDTLFITHIRTACGCTVAEMPEKKNCTK